MLIAPYNDLQTAKNLISEYRDELGAVIVEPMQRLFPPKPGFLAGLRDITADLKIPLIFDEVVTGFRLAYGGGQAYYGVTPDLCTLGKVIGGGFPLAAIAGREDLMAHFERSTAGEEGFTPVIGTLSGNPIAAVAGLATLKVLKQPGTYEKLFATGDLVRASLVKALADAGWKAQLTGEPPMFDAIFTDQPVFDYRSGATGSAALSKAFNDILRSKGIFKSDNKIYISLAHDEADVQHAARAFKEAAEELAAKR
jgi:glutamate-1-semialdehyde 2,1-aminomutase